MHDALAQIMHETNALICSASQNFENRSRKSNFMKKSPIYEEHRP